MNKIFLLAAVLAPLAAGAEALRSPWDAKPVKLTSAPYTAPRSFIFRRTSPPAASTLTRSLRLLIPKNGRRTLPHRAHKDLGQRIVDAADGYRRTGSREAAECSIRHMVAAAKDGVFTGKMSSNQAYYVQGWVIGAIAIAYLKVRSSGLVAADQSKLILPWMVNVVHQTMDYYDARRQKGTGDAGNNHLYWAGVEVAAAGTAANDRKLFDWGMDTYRAGVERIQPDGSLPREMARGQRALHYHLFAVAPLVYLAEFGEDNGMGLYAEHNYAVKRLATLSAEGLLNNSFFEKATGIAQDTPNGAPTAEEISWAQLYIERFPDATISGLLARAPSLSYMYLCGLPPG